MFKNTSSFLGFICGTLLLSQPYASAQTTTIENACLLGDSAYSEGYVINIGQKNHVCDDSAWVEQESDTPEESSATAPALCIFASELHSEGSLISLDGGGNGQLVRQCNSEGRWQPAF